LIQSDSIINIVGLLSTTVFSLPDGIRPSFLGPTSPLSICFTDLGHMFSHLVAIANFLLLLPFIPLLSSSTTWNHLYLTSRVAFKVGHCEASRAPEDPRFEAAPSPCSRACRGRLVPRVAVPPCRDQRSGRCRPATHAPRYHCRPPVGPEEALRRL
jgi:hypothetical protein